MSEDIKQLTQQLRDRSRHMPRYPPNTRQQRGASEQKERELVEEKRSQKAR